MDPDAEPVIQPVRRIPLNLRDKVEKKLNELLDLDIIERVDKAQLADITSCKEYLPNRNELCPSNQLVSRGTRIVVPLKLRSRGAFRYCFDEDSIKE